MGLTASRIVSRTAPMKGVKAVSFAPYDVDDLVANTPTGVATLPVGMTTPPAIYRIGVKATSNNAADVGTFDEETRTLEYANTLTVFAPGNDITLRNELDSLKGILQVVFIEDYNGKVYCLGSQNGADVMTLESGTDLQGFRITINSKEIEPMYQLDASGITVYNSAIV